MDHERFDELAKTLSSGASRRKLIGGAIAGLVGAGVAKVSGADAKGKKKNGKRKAGKEATCSPNPCPPGSCCTVTPPGSGPSCTDVFTQIATGTICGSNGSGGGVCVTCPEGTRCSTDPFTGAVKCLCNRASCPDGCCISSTDIGGDPTDPDICVPNGSGEPVNLPAPFNSVFVCGTAGSFCNVCSTPGGLFTGCCDANGACRAGTSNNNCGSDGELCEVCQNDSTCGIDQACTGGTTTTTTTTTTGPTCVAPKHPCGSNCCGRKQKCITNPDGSFRCKKKKKKKKH